MHTFFEVFYMGVSECVSVLEKTLRYAEETLEQKPRPPGFMMGEIEEKCILADDVPTGLKRDALKAEELLVKWQFDKNLKLKAAGLGIETKYACPSLFKALTKPDYTDEKTFVNFLRGVIERWSYE